MGRTYSPLFLIASRVKIIRGLSAPLRRTTSCAHGSYSLTPFSSVLVPPRPSTTHTSLSHIPRNKTSLALQLEPNDIAGTLPDSSHSGFLMAGLALPDKQPLIYGNRLFSHS